MKPLTMDRVDTMLRAALNSGDLDQILRLSTTMDQLEQADRDRRGVVTLGSAALWYANQGLHVFPLQPGEKTPFRGSHGCKDATTDPGQVQAWWTTAPDANVGIATGHLVDVVDLDGTLGQISRARNADLFTTLHIIGNVNTPRPGGVHLYVPASGKGNGAGLWPGVDYRGVGGYVVAPPSRTSVGVYDWTVPLLLPTTGAVAA